MLVFCVIVFLCICIFAFAHLYLCFCVFCVFEYFGFIYLCSCLFVVEMMVEVVDKQRDENEEGRKEELEEG